MASQVFSEGRIMQKSVLVLGATGPLGRSVALSLKAAGFQVRVMTRSLQKANKMFDGSFEIVADDPLDAGCLEGALEGCYGVHISLPTEVEQPVAETVAKVAPKRGVERITYISGATVAEENRWFPMVNHKFLAEQALRAGKTPVTIFCPTWVMESLPLFVNQGRAAVLGKQPYPYHWVAADNIARMVSKAYALDQTAPGRVIVHGPEAIHMDEALRRYCAALHPEIQKVSGMPFWLVSLLAALTRDQGLKGAGELMAYFEKVGEGNHFPTGDGVFGSPETTLDKWLEQKKEVTPAVAQGFSFPAQV
jgi:uncharacterized protein YbjT (DUF2867 family)